MERARTTVKLNVKFREEAPEGSRSALIGKLASLGASDVHPLFPAATEPELASIYVVECSSQEAAERVLRFLQQPSPVVEYVEPQVSRRLIKGG